MIVHGSGNIPAYTINKIKLRNRIIPNVKRAACNFVFCFFDLNVSSIHIHIFKSLSEKRM